MWGYDGKGSCVGKRQVKGHFTHTEDSLQCGFNNTAKTTGWKHMLGIQMKKSWTGNSIYWELDISVVIHRYVYIWVCSGGAVRMGGCLFVYVCVCGGGGFFIKSLAWVLTLKFSFGMHLELWNIFTKLVRQMHLYIIMTCYASICYSAYMLYNAVQKCRYIHRFFFWSTFKLY